MIEHDKLIKRYGDLTAYQIADIECVDHFIDAAIDAL